MHTAILVGVRRRTSQRTCRSMKNPQWNLIIVCHLGESSTNDSVKQDRSLHQVQMVFRILCTFFRTGGCMSKGTKKAKIHHFSGYASNFKSSIYVIKLLKTNSSRQVQVIDHYYCKIYDLTKLVAFFKMYLKSYMR